MPLFHLHSVLKFLSCGIYLIHIIHYYDRTPNTTMFTFGHFVGWVLSFLFLCRWWEKLEKVLHHIIRTGPIIRNSHYTDQSVCPWQNILTLPCRNGLIGHFIVILLSHQLTTHLPIVIPKVRLFFCVCDRMLRIILTTVVKLWTQFCLSEISK